MPASCFLFRADGGVLPSLLITLCYAVVRHTSNESTYNGRVRVFTHSNNKEGIENMYTTVGIELIFVIDTRYTITVVHEQFLHRTTRVLCVLEFDSSLHDPRQAITYRRRGRKLIRRLSMRTRCALVDQTQA